MSYRANQIVVFTLGLLMTTVSLMATAQEGSGESTAKAGPPTFYTARDSMSGGPQDGKIILYGDAVVDHEGMILKADVIIIDFDKNEVTATFSLDSLGKPVGKPYFTDGDNELTCDSIIYNYNTQKGLIKEVRTQEGEGYLHMAVSKRHPDGNVHLKDGKYTTCDLEEPHFHFHLTKGVIVPNKRVVSGPVNLWIGGVPTPVALPFGYFPNTPDRTHGLILPSYGSDPRYGLFLSKLGYYIPISDKLDTRFFATGYSEGSWGVSNETNYKVKYKYNGGVRLEYMQLRDPFPDSGRVNKVTFFWRHIQDPKSNPYWNFSSDINYQSDNRATTSIDPVNEEYFYNQFNSSIQLNRRWPNRPFTWNTSASLDQNAKLGTVILTLPSTSFNIGQVFPLKVFRRPTTVGPERFYEKIGFRYSINAQNRITAQDTLFNFSDFDLLWDEMFNGVQQRAEVRTTLKLFRGALNISPSVSYREIWNFQYQNRYWDNLNQEAVVDTLQGFKSSRALNAGASATGNIYVYYLTKLPRKLRFRHVINMSSGFTYRPDLGLEQTGYLDGTGNLQTYSPFDISIYPEPRGGQSGVVTFNINQTLEARYNTPDDSTRDHRTLKIIEGFQVSTAYDFFRDSLKWNDIAMSWRSRPTKYLGVTATALFSPYGWVDSTGQKLDVWAPFVNNRLGRFLRASTNVTLTLAPKKDQKRVTEIQDRIADQVGKYWNAELEYLLLNPNAYVPFDVPWAFNATWTMNVSRPINSATNPDTLIFTQTLMMDGNITIAQKWRIKANSTFNINDLKFTYTQFEVTRDLHCWQASFRWVPYGPRQSFLFRINVKASILQDLKYELRDPPDLFN